MLTEKQRQFRLSLLEWGEENYRDFPWREPDRSLYEVFIAEFFLTQTPADNVASVYPTFINRFPSLDAIEDASEDELIKVIRPLGFYNMRAEALERIATKHDRIPETASELKDLPRVGEYVANATLCFARNKPLPVLDRNVERIYERVFEGSWPDSSSEQSEFAARLVPEDDARMYNVSLLDFGDAVCQPDPKCDECFVSDYCDYYLDSSP